MEKPRMLTGVRLWMRARPESAANGERGGEPRQAGSAAEPLLLTQKRERANNQNEPKVIDATSGGEKSGAGSPIPSPIRQRWSAIPS